MATENIRKESNYIHIGINAGSPFAPFWASYYESHSSVPLTDIMKAIVEFNGFVRKARFDVDASEGVEGKAIIHLKNEIESHCRHDNIDCMGAGDRDMCSKVILKGKCLNANMQKLIHVVNPALYNER